MHVPVCEHAHACVYNYGSPSAEQDAFLFGKAICWNRPAPFILSLITMQGKTEQNRKGMWDKWCSTATESMSGTTLLRKSDNSSWSEEDRETGRESESETELNICLPFFLAFIQQLSGCISVLQLEELQQTFAVITLVNVVWGFKSTCWRRNALAHTSDST